MTDLDLAYATATELGRRYRAKELSPVEVMKNALGRIEDANAKLNCFCFTYPEEALEKAHATERAVMAGEDPGPLAGVPITNFLSQEKIDAIVKRTQMAGGEVVKLLGTSAWVSPAASAIEMAECFIKDKKRILPCAAYLEGEYGIDGYYLGVPVVIGAGGVERVIELPLNADEKDALATSFARVKDVVASVKL